MLAPLVEPPVARASRRTRFPDNGTRADRWLRWWRSLALEALCDLTDGGQAAVPLGADRVEPAGGGAQLRPEHAVAHLAPDAHRLDEADLLEHGEVLGDRLAAHRQSAGQGRRRGVALAERRQHAPPGVVAEGGEHGDHRRRHEPLSTSATSLSSSPSQPSRWLSMLATGSDVRSKPVSTTVSTVPPATGSRVKVNTVECSSSSAAGGAPSASS